MTTHPRNYPDDQIEHPDQGSAPDPDHYDDATASDVLHKFIRDQGNYAVISIGPHGGPQLELSGDIRLTPEQAAVLSPLIPVSRGGTLQP